MALSVKLEVFEGPLDLLLHLIDKNKIDIYDIPIVLITEQYMDYIKKMETEDMNVMSEFLLMAATLLDIKCKVLLPKDETVTDEEEEDPRAELVQKLLEYKMYKYMSFELKDMSMNASKNIYKAPTIPEEVAAYREPVDYETLLGEVNLQKLNEIFKETMRRREDKIDPIRSKFGNIEKDEIDLDAKTEYIKSYLWREKKVSFRELLEKQGSKMEIIVAFLIVLELIKIGLIKIKQNDLFDDIIIKVMDVSQEEFLGAQVGEDNGED